MEDRMPQKTILFLGDERVGKTTFIKNYCQHQEIMRELGLVRCDINQGTFLAFTQFVLNREGRAPWARFLDLPAGTTEESRRDQYPHPTEVNSIVLCFAVNNPTSLDNVWQIWLPELRQHYPEPQRFYLLGLKSRLRITSYEHIFEEREHQVHQQYGFSGDYLECSVEEDSEEAVDCMNVLVNDA